MRNRSTFALFILATALLAAGLAQAENRRIVHQGRVLRPTGLPLQGSFQMEAKIYSPSPTSCLMWAESKSVNFHNGTFTMEIGDSIFRLAGASGGSSVSFQSVFFNNAAYNLTGANCQTGSTYNPVSSDGRQLVITLYDGPQVIKVYEGAMTSVPYALEAANTNMVGGYDAAHIFKYNEAGSHQASLTFSTLGASFLWNLAENSDFSGRPMTGLGDPTNPTDAVNLQSMNAAITAAVTGGTIPTVTHVQGAAGANATSILDIAGGPITTSGTLSFSFLNQNAGLIFAAPTGAAGAPSFRALQPSDLPALDAAKITSGTLPVSLGGTGLDSFTPYALLASNMTGDSLVQWTCSTGDVLVWQAGTGWACEAKASSGQWSTNSNGIHYSGGSVGIGTANPQADLHVAGDMIVNSITGPTSLSLSAGGAAQMVFYGAFIQLDGNLEGSGGGGSPLILRGNGNASNPTYSFLADEDTGIYRGGANDIRVATGGNDRITVDALGNVGIGTSTPGGYRLSVNGNMAVSGIYNYSDSDTSIQFYADGAQIIGNGRIGMDVYKGSDFTVSVGDAVEASGTIAMKNNTHFERQASIGTQNSLLFRDLDDSNYVALRAPATVASNVTWTLPSTDGTAGQVLRTNGTGALSWVSPGSSSSGTAGAIQISDGSGGFSNDQGHFVWDSGNRYLGVGRSSPTAALDVENWWNSGDITGIFRGWTPSANTPLEVLAITSYTVPAVEPGSGPQIGFYGNSDNSTWRSYASIAAIVTDVDDFSRDADLVFSTANNLVSNATAAESMRLTSGGSLGIGTPSPSEKLHVVGNLRVQGSTNCVLGDGAGGTNCSSDERLKDDIQPLNDSLSRIGQLRGVSFLWNEKSNSPGRHDIGVIAQDVEKVFPTAVREDKASGYKMVDYAVLVSPLIEAVKSLHSKVKALIFKTDSHSAQIAELQGTTEKQAREISSLKAQVEKSQKENDEMKARLDALEKSIMHK